VLLSRQNRFSGFSSGGKPLKRFSAYVIAVTTPAEAGCQ